MTRRKVALIGWGVIGAAAVAWEALGLRSAGDDWPTATDLIRTLPQWVIWMVLGWALWHFGVSRRGGGT